MNAKIQYPSEPPKEPPKSVIAECIENKRRFSGDLGLWLTHDPAIYQDEESGYYYIYCTEAVCQRSKDLIHWEMVGKVIEKPPAESSEWVGGDAIWAPDIVKVGEEYRLYCSNSSFGVRKSCIFLAVADNPEGPFIPRGCVLKTTDEMPVNAIDANIITDAKSGEMYMVYGSFWGGCHILLLDKETGLVAEEGIGTCLSCRPKWLSAAVEGPYMVYNPDTDYYYLFVSYGSLKTDYQVRVGRSKNIKGPFLDFNGRKMTDIEDSDNTVGLLEFCGYHWNDGVEYMAPGHNSILHDKDGSWYLVCHIREKNFRNQPEPSTMQVRRIFWTPDGWPVLSAEPYAGEKEQPIEKDALFGLYERINLVPSLPQGIQTAVPMKLAGGDYYECCSIQGIWQYDGELLSIAYGPHKEKAFVSTVWDVEKNQPTLAITGISEKGIAFWAKRVGDLPDNNRK